MKTKLILATIFQFLVIGASVAQNHRTIVAYDPEIASQLDLKAVISIFGDSRNLFEFEQKLNDPRIQISNLDLNADQKVDYLRVIESVDYNTHVVLIQAILGRNSFQDVATIDIEKDNYNNIHVQIIGNEFLYGQNFIYEPVYYRTPAIYASIYINNYRPYYSAWNWNYYPSYYVAWHPIATYNYFNNINICINNRNSYRNVKYRYCKRAPKICHNYRYNDFETRYVEVYHHKKNHNYRNSKDNFHYGSNDNYNNKKREQNETNRNNTNRKSNYDNRSNNYSVNNSNYQSSHGNNRNAYNTNKRVSYQSTKRNANKQEQSNYETNNRETRALKNNSSSNENSNKIISNENNLNGRRNSAFTSI